MLGWALNKATGTTPLDKTSAPGPDDTFVEQPDTPAPVFAARALKRALFGTPAPPPKEAPKKETKPAAAKSENNSSKPAMPESTAYDSPSKPQGILLTPGTGTTRRKRVSFGRDVKATNPALSEMADGANRTRPKTRLQEALENSRKRRDNRHSSEDDARKIDVGPAMNKDDADDVWEEIDELDRDGTVDLNEPRSQSGRYWKSEFQKYHEEAQAEMEKLVKYKQLAKSYAKAKDAEAMDLTERLKEEQAKAAEMERRTVELASTLRAKHGRITGGQDDKELLKDLTRQTALAVQYRKKVDELEACLRDSGYEADGHKRRYGGQPMAREQAKELNDLRQELQRAKSNVTVLEERERKAEAEKRDIERKLSRKDAQYNSLKAEYAALKDKNRTLRDEVLSLKRTPQLGNTALLKDDLKAVATGTSIHNARSRNYDDLQSNIRKMEDASLTINLLQEEFKRTTDLKSSAQRKSNAETRTRRGQTPKLDDTIDLLQYRPISAIKRTATPLSRSVARGSKRTVSGRVVDKRPEPAGLASARAAARRSDTPKTVDLTRLSSKARLGLVTERALDSESDPDFRANVPSSRHVTTRPSLASDRRAAAIARLDQKRAERKRSRDRSAIPGKENFGL